jgi:hypothetical protein
MVTDCGGFGRHLTTFAFVSDQFRHTCRPSTRLTSDSTKFYGPRGRPTYRPEPRRHQRRLQYIPADLYSLSCGRTRASQFVFTSQDVLQARDIFHWDEACSGLHPQTMGIASLPLERRDYLADSGCGSHGPYTDPRKKTKYTHELQRTLRPAVSAAHCDTGIHQHASGARKIRALTGRLRRGGSSDCRSHGTCASTKIECEN